MICLYAVDRSPVSKILLQIEFGGMWLPLLLGLVPLVDCRLQLTFPSSLVLLLLPTPPLFGEYGDDLLLVSVGSQVLVAPDQSEYTWISEDVYVFLS